MFGKTKLQIKNGIAYGMVHNLPNINVEVGRDYIKMMVCYALTGMPEDDIIELKDLITNSLIEEDGDEVMRTAAQALWDKGHQDGIEQNEKVDVVMPK